MAACIVLTVCPAGAYFGTGSRGGIMSTFLMGVLDHATKRFKTVCKVRRSCCSAFALCYSLKRID
jgi:ATP-dependent DNA ligase